MNWESLALQRFLLRLLAPRRTRFAFCRAHRARRIVSRFEQPWFLAPRRTRFAFCRAHQARRILGRFEQLLHAARLLKKFEIPAHECSAAPISDIDILSIKSGSPLNL